MQNKTTWNQDNLEGVVESAIVYKAVIRHNEESYSTDCEEVKITATIKGDNVIIKLPIDYVASLKKEDNDILILECLLVQKPNDN